MNGNYHYPDWSCAVDTFIHLSTAAQVPLTAARFFGEEGRLWVVKIERGRLEVCGQVGGVGEAGGRGVTEEGREEGGVTEEGREGGGKERKEEKGKGELRWEPTSNHGVFAHWYGEEIGCEAVVSVLEVERKEGQSWEAVLGGLEE